MLGCKGLRYLVELYSVPRTVWMSSGCRFYSRGRWNWDETFLAICLSKEKCLRRRPRVQILSMHQLKELSDSTQHWGIFCFEDSKIRIAVLLKCTYTTCTVPSVFNGLLLIFPSNSCLVCLTAPVESSRGACWEVNLSCVELGNQFENNGTTVLIGTCLDE